MPVAQFKTVQDLRDYIEIHNVHLGYPPTAIGLEYQDYINILREMGGDGRCTNLQAHIGGVKVVRL